MALNPATKSDSWVRNPDGSLGFTSSPVTGCLNGCPYCFARSLASGRLREKYLANKNTSDIKEGISDLAFALRYENPFYPRFWPERLEEIKRHKKPAGIFLCIMGEIFGDWVPRAWQDAVFETIKACPQHRFYLLTKQYQNLAKFSPFPPNCWVGVSTTNRAMWFDATWELQDIKASVKFLSFEPLLSWSPSKKEPLDHTSYMSDLLKRAGISWVIIGAMTGTKRDIWLDETGRLEMIPKHYPQLTPMPWGRRWTLQPPISWVQEIVEAADKAGIPVFLKENLRPLLQTANSYLFWKNPVELRQELPRENRNVYR